MNRDEGAIQHAAANTFFTEVFSKKRKSKGKTLIKFVSRTIRQYKLGSQVSVEEVIGEAYERALRTVDRGVVIENYAGWTRTTCHNIVRELYRKKKRKHKAVREIEIEIADSLRNRRHAERICLSAGWSEKLVETWRSLSKSDKEILKLRLLDGRKWSQITEIISKRRGHAVNEASLRKRGERAQKKLREIYLSLTIED